ncbi:sigma-54-dependent Fis family transcriptional regulator [Acidaminobacter sp. JC074]|uniref:sigma-54 interaction domain-containing protein n=1 Tax=Acidaminobacter sp. JC074 TaxID=2530199 RepID=UPI001F0D67CA|nr:sigma 54-interacting transcriptional regulator [Acidaminobacter sp. JC074]
MQHFAFEHFPEPIIVYLNDEFIYSNLIAEEDKGLLAYVHNTSVQRIKSETRITVKNTSYNIKTFKVENMDAFLFQRDQEKEQNIKLKLYEEIMNNINQGIFVTNKEDLVMYVNKTALDIEAADYSPDDLIERNSLYSNQSPNAPHDYIFKTKKALTNQKVEYQMSNGQQVSVISDNYPFFYEGNLEAVYSIYQNYDVISENIAHQSHLLQNFVKHPSQTDSFQSLIGNNDKFLFTKKIAMKAAKNNSNVLLFGETGTGKELFAQAIHQASERANEPFIAINCAAIPETLMESIFFGATKGAYTGAVDSIGIFEEAKNGTVFLDEINSMNIILQAKLLRVLQEKTIRKLGSNQTIDINCRIISSTNKDPLACIENNELRDDLYYRLSSFVVEIPSLKDRKNDIPLLIKHFQEVFNHKFSYYINDISPEFLELLKNYDFPGNVRELRHMIEAMFISADFDTNTLTRDLLPSYIYKKMSDLESPIEDSKPLTTNSISDINKNLEKNLITMLLKENNYHITNTATQLGISRQSLQYRLKKYEINTKKHPV